MWFLFLTHHFPLLPVQLQHRRQRGGSCGCGPGGWGAVGLRSSWDRGLAPQVWILVGLLIIAHVPQAWKSQKGSIFTPHHSWIQRWKRIHDSGWLLLTFGDVGALVDGGKQSIPIVRSAAAAAARGFADVHGGRRWHRWRWGTAPSRGSRGRSYRTLGRDTHTHTQLKSFSALTDKQLRPVKVSTHALAPAQSGGVVLLDVALQVSPDGQVSLDPVYVCLVPVETRRNKLTRLLQHSSRHSRPNRSDRLFRLSALKRLHVKQKNRKWVSQRADPVKLLQEPQKKRLAAAVTLLKGWDQKPDVCKCDLKLSYFSLYSLSTRLV